MTTAHKPTYHPAVGSAHQGGYRYHAPKAQTQARDLPGHLTLKTRQIGQGAPEEMEARDMKAELEKRERDAKEKQLTEKRREGLLPYAEEALPPDPNKAIERIDFKKFDDSDDSDDDDEGEGSESEDEEDEEAQLLRELEKIKKEREEEKKRKEAEEKEAIAKAQEEEILKSNPLLVAKLAAADEASNSFAVKRRWDEDVVFKNQSRDARKPKKRFINDTIRSDFHRNFLKRYIK